MKERLLATAVTFLLFLCSGTVAVPSKTAPPTEDEPSKTTPPTKSGPTKTAPPTSRSNTDKDPSPNFGTKVPSSNGDTTSPPRSGGITASGANQKSDGLVQISSVYPPDNANLAGNDQGDVSLSFQVQADAVRRIRFFIGSVGAAMEKFVVRGDADNYSLDLTSVPAGTYAWRFEVITDSSDSDQRKQKFGPWTFTFGATTAGTNTAPAPPAPAPGATPPAPPAPSSITAGLQSDCFSVDNVNFNICLDLKSVSGNYEPWMDDFGAAKLRWQSILKDDGQSPLNLNSYFKGNRDLIATGLPPQVDDIYISGFLQPNDGQGGVLGMASPYLSRTDPNGYSRPVAGYMVFDSDDQAWLSQQGIWTNTILHEMGHVLGLGTLWQQNGLTSGSVTDDRYKANSNAEAAWEQLCPGGRLPVETLDPSQGITEGTAGGHWDEACLVNELMTGFVNAEMPLSTITIASLADMGYTVDYSKADPYGRDDLGDCGAYCPDLQKRHLRGMAEELRFRNKVSANGHLKILQAAAKHMHKLRSAKPAGLPSILKYAAGEQLTVYILDEDGGVKDETVSWDEAKKYAPDDAIPV